MSFSRLFCGLIPSKKDRSASTAQVPKTFSKGESESKSSNSVDFTVYRGTPEGKIRTDTTHRDLRPDDVVIKITHSGLCFTDMHYVPSGCVLGHEGVGIVSKVGPGVKHTKVGDHVGWGYMRDTCGKCEYCLQGDDMYCPEADFYGIGSLDLGSMATHTVIREPFTIPIPKEIDLKYAGPLMCAGGTVYETLIRYGIGPSDRVGVVGIGGVGHMAIMMASKMGCQVVAFSGTESKREEALALGANEFCATKGVTDLKAHVEPVQYLIVTANASPDDWKKYIPILKPKATVFPLTIDPTGTLQFPTNPINPLGFAIQGSAVASRWVYKKMLDFVVRHDIKPVIQEFPLTVSGIEEAMKRLNEGKIRYRAVLVAQD